MEARVTEVADGVHQLSTFVGAPVGFNQYLVAEELYDATTKTAVLRRPVHSVR